jgi:hypothetical protein
MAEGLNTNESVFNGGLHYLIDCHVASAAFFALSVFAMLFLFLSALTCSIVSILICGSPNYLFVSR